MRAGWSSALCTAVRHTSWPPHTRQKSRPPLLRPGRQLLCPAALRCHTAARATPWLCRLHGARLHPVTGSVRRAPDNGNHCVDPPSASSIAPPLFATTNTTVAMRRVHVCWHESGSHRPTNNAKQPLDIIHALWHCQHIRWVPHPAHLLNCNPPVCHGLLHPKELQLNVTELAQSSPCCHCLCRRRVSLHCLH